MSGDTITTLVLSLAAFSFLGLLGLLTARGPKSLFARLETAAERSPASQIITPHDHNSSKPTTNDRSNQTIGRLVQAGFYRRDSIAHFVMVKCGLTALSVLLGCCLGLVGAMPMKIGLLTGAVTGLFCTILPSFWLDALKRKRQNDLRRALPDALDLILVSVEAGLSLPAALLRVGRELRSAYALLASEMVIVEREIRLGYTAGEAIRRFSERFDLAELRSLAAVLQQAERFGASISQALRVHSEGLRTKRFQLAEEKAQKASVKLLVPTLLFIFPSLFVVIMGPAVFDLYAMLIQLSQST